ncbi:MAG: hypothetical protein A2Y28_03750 [Chlamydiae bacterium GWC2_50_10]|nr:MAG: hypothetical protein A2Z85_05215 [Chlamydiae bacterium GWA2_50_15]OGN53691.1 MAG: hypothetical protein A2Y28_03750 [Chlamydiae bacterium GWC2_50_10]OGN55053.1 MAG: hypothetical protein A2098_03110 [Chlamydiae bacterium GWF2_49_8]OGN63217.1 MAG: hypothetical protein A3E26_03790 [Chlamydiae bacterium RIFCSPHIGHO2_12_FULL_49_32]OGN71618.1 MAG: hypothetical protein A3G30_01190 [Chlamydiae bacterium RIFCSPLOWO2_12_FULL_49_12]
MGMASFKDKQPQGLRLLYATELTERIAFYTLQTLLILYMSEGLNLSDDRAYLLFGAYSALLYLTAVVGGYLADRFLGFQKAILFGGWLFVLSYLLLVIPDQHFFYLGLSVNIVANGLFKPNVTSILGELYEGPEDPRRDAGYTLFYMGINIGSLLPPLFLGGLILWFNWQGGFSLAVLAMLVAMWIFLKGRGQLKGAGGIPLASLYHHRGKKRVFLILFFSVITLVIFFLYLLLHFAAEVDLFVGVVSILFILMVLYLVFKEKGRERVRMGAALLLTIISTAFWTFYAQQPTSLVLFAKRNMRKELLGIPLDAEATLFFSPFFIILFCPLLSKLWLYLQHRRRDWSTPIKFAFGILLMALGFLILGIGTRFFGKEALLSPWWMIFCFAFQALGEVLLSPIGLSMITALSPHAHIGLMMGVWFLAQASAFALGGKLATFSTVLPRFTLEESLAVYSRAFLLFFWICFFFAVVAFLLAPLLNRMIHPKKTAL